MRAFPIESLEPRRLFAAIPGLAEPVVAAAAEPLQFGRVDGRNVKLTLADARGTPVTFKLSGRGLGEVTVADDGFEVVLQQTTASTSVTVSTASTAATALRAVTATGPLKKFTAKTADLAGDFTVAGTLSSLRLRDVTGPARLSITGTGRSASLSLGDVAELSVDSNAPLRSVKAARWLDADASPDRISAPWIGTLAVDGDLGADVELTDTIKRTALGKLVVLGVLDGATVRAIGDMQKVVLGAMRNSVIFAGVRAGETQLPDSLDDFTAASRIRSFSALGLPGQAEFAFEASGIAASQMGTVRLGTIAPSETGQRFGLVADRVSSYRRELSPLGTGGVGNELKLRRVDEPGVADAETDFRLTLL